MTANRYQINKSNFIIEILDDSIPMHYSTIVNRLNEQHKTIIRFEKENEELKSTIAQLIEQNRKNNDLLLSDIRILEKALWCSGCENDYGRLKELRKEFMR